LVQDANFVTLQELLVATGHQSCIGNIDRSRYHIHDNRLRPGTLKLKGHPIYEINNLRDDAPSHQSFIV